MGVLVAGMTAEHVLERLTDGVAVITPGDRSDVVLAVVSAHAAEGFPSLSCIILNGGLELHPSIAALVSGLGLRLPIIATTLRHLRNGEQGRGGPRPGHRVVATQDRHRAGVDGHPRRHRGSACAAGDSDSDGGHPADVHLPAAGPGAGGSQAHRAARRRGRPHPQGGRAAAAAQRCRADHPRRGGADPGPRRRTRRRPVGRRRCSNPRTSELCDRFAEQYAELRKHKGVTVEQAREIIHDVSYFGTMLVHNDMVDGMVSGATHTTAHTVRPAFEIIKTQPGHHHGVQHLPDVPGRPGAGLRRLRDRARPDVRATGRHRDLVGAHRRAVRHRSAGGDAVLLDRHLGHRRRRRQGQGGNRIGARAGNPICWWRVPSSTTPRSIRRWRRPRCPTRRSPAGRPC